MEEEDHDEHGHDADHDDSNTIGIDPHGWLDPENGKVWLDVIATVLSEKDPANANAYFKNASDGKLQIDTIIAKIDQSLESFRGTRFIVFHDAYQYFERRFDIPATGSISLGDASDPSPARISKLHRMIKELGITCIFTEPQFNPGLVNAITTNNKMTVGIIDPLGSHLSLGKNFYPDLLSSIAETIKDCRP